ncbi:MAG: cytochrome ubiquinol oxidase subunit I [Pseudomonadota bacterium]
METSLAVDLARVQFAFTVSFHIIFPALTIGLAAYLAVLEGLWLKTKKSVYYDLYRFWIKIFAVAFGMGVVSGVVMSYQFGTNWSRFSDITGNVLGPLISYEVLTAFFLEAGFLGIMLFGWGRVGPKLHFFATCMVSLGTLISAFWILSANSWMHTPAGFGIDPEGRFIAEDWMEIIFNPSFPYRYTHMMLAAFLTTSFVVAAVGAWHLLQRRGDERARVMFSMAMWMAAIVAPMQMIAGDQQGLNTLEYQPVKIAAMEGIWPASQSGVCWSLIGWPNMEKEVTEFDVCIPHLGSLLLTHEWSGEVKGLKNWPADERPNATVIFWTFRIMVAIGLAMMAMGMISIVLRINRRLYDARWFHKLALVMGPSGFIAVLCGWVTTEMGRQPWVVFDHLRTADAASPLTVPEVATTLALFVIVYIPVFGIGTYYLIRLMRKDFADLPAVAPAGGPGRQQHAKRPLSAAQDPALPGRGAGEPAE